MRLVVTSDVHKRTSALFDIVERHLDNADLFINLGDSANEVEELLMVYPDLKIECVAGNCDFSSSQPLTKLIQCKDKKVFITHGHPFYVKHGYGVLKQKAKDIKADICLFGHTHIPYTEIDDGIYYMNPGAVCDYSYGIIDITDKGIMFYTTKI
ncbi:MAG: YfcE family phosphodiesterase [Eubacterium sp.]|nr:YfcE family phosphodiesterase [Eubacterium sp.]